MKRRLTALLLSLCMVISLFPVTAFADTLTDPIIQIDDSHSHESSEEAAYTSPAAITLNLRGGTVVDSGTCGENATWTFSSDGTLTISGSGDMTDYTMSLYVPWKNYAKQITTVNIEQGITGVGDFAFAGCANVASVSLPAGLTRIGMRAFNSCETLREISLPDGLLSIGKYAFYECYSIKTVVLPSSLTTIEQSTFSYCSNLASVVFPVSIDTVSNSAFDGTVLKDVYYDGSSAEWESISIGNNNTKLTSADVHFVQNSGNCGTNVHYVFYDGGLLIISGEGNMSSYSSSNQPWYSFKDNISRIIIEKGVTSIGNYGFTSCSSLVSVSLPEGLFSIGSYAFYVCSSLKEINIPVGVTVINSNTFGGCSSLTDISFPNGLTNIYSWAFSGCTGLRRIFLPESLVGISQYAFPEGDDSLTVYYGGSQESWENIEINASGNNALRNAVRHNGVLAIGTHGDYVEWSLNDDGLLTLVCSGDIPYTDSYYTGSAPWREYVSRIKKVEFYGGFTETSFGMFVDFANLVEVTLPDTMIAIADNTFMNCSSLQTVSFPVGMTDIGYSAFDYCNSLESVVLPEGLLRLDGSFSYCANLKNVSIPSTVTSFEDFYDCTSLLSVTIDPNNSAYSDIDGVVYNKAQTELILFPAGRSGDYVIPDGVISLYYNAFRISKLESLHVPASVTDLGRLDLLCGNALQAISVSSDNDTYCDVDGVLYSKDLKKMMMCPRGFSGSHVMPEGVTSIESPGFSGCTELEGVSLPDSLTTIAQKAFSSCSKLESIYIPRRINSIDRNVFRGCTNLSKVTIDSQNGSLCDINGIIYNRGLTSLIYCPENYSGSHIVPGTVTEIQREAFYRCPHISSIAIPAAVTTIGDFAFSGCDALTDVFYTGTEAQWNSISVSYANSSMNGLKCNASLKAANIHYLCREGQCGEKAYWIIDDNSRLLISGSGPMYNYNTGEYYPYASTAPWVDLSYSSIQIDEGITTIGTYAFKYSPAASLEIPSTLETIGIQAFYEADIEALAFPDGGNVVINENAFMWCSSLETIDFGNCTVTMRYSTGNSNSTEVFACCKALTSLVIPSTVTLGAMDFYHCDALETAEVHCAFIPRYSFECCISLSSIDLTGVETIDAWVFDGTTSLVDIVFPESVTSIGIRSNGQNEPIFFTQGDHQCGITNLTFKNPSAAISSELIHNNLNVPNIYGYDCSTAHRFATSNRYNFIPLEGDTSTHVEGAAVIERQVSATCLEDGGFDEVVYCSVCGIELSRVHTAIPATGHDYEITYVWSDDNSSATATAICSNNADHMITETVAATGEVTKAPTITEYGETTYTAVFSDTTFTTQTKTVADIPPVPVKRGDADGDGEVDALDRVLLSQYLAGWPGAAERIVDLNAMDINKDGKVNAKDRMILARYLADWGEPYDSYFKE